MLACAVSGQTLGITFISAFSGTPLTGLSGFCSGYKISDLGAQAGISGFIVEGAFGQYIARLYDWDCSGRIISYYFTAASGAIPVEKTVVTTLNVSGREYPASGVNVTVPPVTLSGVFANVPIATVSGINAVVPIATVSGITTVVIKETISGVVANSGLFVTATASVASGSLYLASGSIFRETYASGVLGASGGHTLAWGNSGQSLPASGVNVVVPPATLSGVFATVPIATVSGITTVVIKETISGVVANSGLFVNVPIATVSGINVVLPKETISGVVANSGLFVTATASVASGSLYLASGSIFRETFASGVLGGSGAIATAWGSSGRVVLAAAAAHGGGSGTSLNLEQLFVLSALSGKAAVWIAGPSGGVDWGHAVSIRGGEAWGVGVDVVSVAGAGITVDSTEAALSLINSSSGHQTIELNSPPGMAAIRMQSTAVGSGGGIHIQADPAIIADGTTSSMVVSVVSGALHPASGKTFIASGPFVNAPVATLSGVFANVPIATVSGITAVVIKETISGVIANSGLFVTATASVASGSVYLASGSIFRETYASGVLGASGGHTLAWGNSGQSLSASGASVVVLIASISGANAVVPPATLSGVVANSGLTVNAFLASGQSTLVYSGQLSGQQVTARTVTDKSGYVLANSGLDLVMVESGMNLRQAMAVTTAAAGGQLSGAGTATITIDGANASGVNRVSAAVDASGNRTTVTLTLPG